MSTSETSVEKTVRKQKRAAQLRRRSDEHSAIGRIVGSKLRDLRRAAGLTQEEAAHKAALDFTYPSLLESGKRIPTITIFIRYVRALGGNPSDVLEWLEKALYAEGLVRGW